MSIINSACNNYYNRDLESLSKDLDTTDKRINFEKWLLDNFSSNPATNSDFTWNSKVITLIFTKTGKDLISSADDKKEEDHLLADLISKVTPLPENDQEIPLKSSSQTAQLVHQTSGKILNFSQIYNEIKDADLPATSALVRKIVEFQDNTLLSDIKSMKFMLKTSPEEFKALLASQEEKGKTLLYQAICMDDIEMVKLMAEIVPDEFKAALTLEESEGWMPATIEDWIPLTIAAKNNNVEMMKLMAKTLPDEFKFVMTIPDPEGYTLFARAVKNNNIEMMQLIADTAPAEFKAALTLEESEGWMPATIEDWIPLTIAAKNNNVEMMKLMAKTLPDEFKFVMTIPDPEGYTLLARAAKNHNIEMMQLILDIAPDEFKAELIIAAKNNNVEMMKLMAKAVPDDFKAVVTMQDSEGCTLPARAAKNNDMEMMQLIVDTAPDEFKTAMTMQDQNEKTPLDIALAKQNVEMVKLIADSAPDEFKMILTIEEGGWMPFTIDWWVPLTIAAKNNNVEVMKLMAKTLPDEFKFVMTMPDPEGYTPLARAAKNNNMEMMQLIADIEPDEFKVAMKIQDKSGATPLAIALFNNNMEMVKLMTQIAPDEFKAAVTMQDKDGQSSLAMAVMYNNIEMVKLIANAAPDEFKVAATMQDKRGWPPILITAHIAHNVEVVKFLIENVPETLNFVSESGESVLSSIKKSRPSDYREITQLFKHNLAIRQLRKAQFQRKALAHAWHLSGTTQLITNEEKQTLAKTDLEGHLSPEWFHLMGKNLNQFKESYPGLLSENQNILLEQLFETGANAGSPEDTLKRIQAGLPTVINAGYSGHAVTLLIWGDSFAICNRGEATRNPIDVFHFNPLNFDLNDLLSIKNNKKYGKRENYEKLFFVQLPQKLEFSKSKLDQQFEKISQLPFQTVGNCSIVSPFTAIYASLLLESVRGSDEAGVLSPEGPELGLNPITPSSPEGEQIKKTLSLYQTWLSNQQINTLESVIKPLEQGNLVFEPDHVLIMAALRRAHLLPLDQQCQKRLEGLTEIYLNSLDQEKRIEVKSDLVSCQALPRVPLF